MDRNKCRGCGLVNGLSAPACGRCGKPFVTRDRDSRLGPREAAERSSWLYTFLFLSTICGIAYYLVTGVERSYKDVEATVNRVAAQPSPQSYEFKSRTDADQKRTVTFKNAIQNSPGLAASGQHVADTQKLIEPENKR